MTAALQVPLIPAHLYEVAKLDEQDLRTLSDVILSLHRRVDWNNINRNCTPGRDAEEMQRLPRRPAPFDSWLEYRLFGMSDSPLKKIGYENSEKLTYTLECTYTPDAVVPGTRLYIESKGAFRERTDARKHVVMREQLKVDFLFVFQTRGVALPWALTKSPRKDGSYQTHEDWARHNGFAFCFEDELPAFMRSAEFAALCKKNLLRGQVLDMASIVNELSK